MLCESLLLLLIETGVVAKQGALDSIDGVLEVKKEIAGVRESVVVSMASIALLQRVRESISAGRGPGSIVAV